jgi:hypothetical protein
MKESFIPCRMSSFWMSDSLKKRAHRQTEQFQPLSGRVQQANRDMAL